MTTRTALLASIAHTIHDYRAGEIAAPTPEHVARWLGQFDAAVQVPLLSELDHVLKRTYLSRAKVEAFLTGLITNVNLVGGDPCAFWRGVTFLNIQGGGNSQREMLAIFDSLLKLHCGFGIADCGVSGNAFVYLDDVLFSGNRVLGDIKAWIQSTAPTGATVHVIAMAYHTGGQYYADNGIAAATTTARKGIKFTWWRMVAIEDRKSAINTSDVLRPRMLGNSAHVNAYAQTLVTPEFPIVYRTSDSIGGRKIFSSENGRACLEQVLLEAGVRVRQQCTLLGESLRPLGFSKLKTLGFGSTIVTFRNCPNNVPLALWAGSPWYPLFARKTN